MKSKQEKNEFIVRKFSNRVEVFIPLLMLVFALICTTQGVNTFIGFAPIFVNADKSQQAHNAVLTSAQILAGTALDLITGEGVIDRLWRDFEEAKKNA